MALESANEPTDEPLSTLGSEPLVPILQVDAGQLDPVALGTWHQALSNTVSVEVPHDLMGLWLYPSQGGVALLGPPELAADDLAMPIPSPHLTSEQLSGIEKTVLNAGYGSVPVCRFASASETWRCCWWPISSPTDTDRPSGCCCSAWRGGWGRCWDGLPGSGCRRTDRSPGSRSGSPGCS